MANGIISRLKAELGLDRSKFKKGLKQSEGDAEKFGSKIESIGKKIGGAFAGYFAFSTIIQGFKSLIDTNRNFEKSLSSLQSITGVTREELKFYADEAKRMGATTTQSASQVADAFALIGSKKPDLLESKEALVSVTEQAITLAEAANIDVVQAATALTNSLNQMGKSADFAGDFINALAAGSKVGAANIPYLNAAIEKAGATASAVGLEFNELVAAIETIAPNIAEPTTAGLQLRQVLIKLTGDVDKFNPTVVGLGQALKNLQKEQLTVNDLTNKFGIINVNAAKALIDGADAYENYRTKVTGTNTALEQQAINTDNLDGSIKNLGSAWEGWVLTLQKSNGTLQATTQYLADMINQISGVSKELAAKEFSEGLLKNLTEKTEKEGTQLRRVLSIKLDELDQEFTSSNKRLEKYTNEFGLIQGSLSALSGGYLFGNRLKNEELNNEKILKARELLISEIKKIDDERFANEQKKLIASLNLNEKTEKELVALKVGASKEILSAIKDEEDKRISASQNEIRNIENLTIELENLKTEQQTATGSRLADINREIQALNEEINALRNLGLEIKRLPQQDPIDISAIPKIPDSEFTVKSNVETPGLPDTLTTEGTIGAQIEEYTRKVNDSTAAMQRAQQTAAAYSSSLSSLGSIARQSGNEQVGAMLDVLSTTIMGVAQIMAAKQAETATVVSSNNAQAISGIVAQGAQAPWFMAPAVIASGLALVASIFSSIGGGGSRGGGSAPVTSIDTRRMTSPSTNISTRTNTTQQSIKVEVEGRIDNKTIALANKKGTKELNR